MESFNINNHTGLSVESFKPTFDHVEEKAAIMHCWRGPKGAKDTSKPKIDRQVRALSFEQEFLLTMMKLRLDLLLFGLAFRFNVAPALFSPHGSNSWLKNSNGR